MSRGISKKNVIESVLKGIEQASDDFCKISGWESLWYAPEYFLTCSIARELASHEKGELTIEDCVRGTMEVAGSNGPGRPRNGLRKNGRFDLVLWWKGGTPRAVIEVKHPLYARSTVFIADIIRIRDALVASQRNGGSIKFGGLAFWTGANRSEKNKDIEKRINNIKVALEESAAKLVKDEFIVKIHHGQIHKVDDAKWGWAAFFLTIEPKKVPSLV